MYNYLFLQITEQLLCRMNKVVKKAGDIISISVTQKTFQSLLHLLTFGIIIFITSAKYLRNITDDFLVIEDIIGKMLAMYTYMYVIMLDCQRLISRYY